MKSIHHDHQPLNFGKAFQQFRRIADYKYIYIATRSKLQPMKTLRPISSINPSSRMKIMNFQFMNIPQDRSNRAML